MKTVLRTIQSVMDEEQVGIMKTVLRTIQSVVKRGRHHEDRVEDDTERDEEQVAITKTVLRTIQSVMKRSTNASMMNSSMT